jgi:hypothetical protein
MSSISTITSVPAITPLGNAGLLLPSSRTPQKEPTQKCNMKNKVISVIFIVYI